MNLKIIRDIAKPPSEAENFLVSLRRQFNTPQSPLLWMIIIQPIIRCRPSGPEIVLSHSFESSDEAHEKLKEGFEVLGYGTDPQLKKSVDQMIIEGIAKAVP